jgi:hypothetical protein
MPMNKPHPQDEIDRISNSVWETAVRRNPMVLVKLIDPHAALERLRSRIQEYLARGFSELETHDQAVNELLQSAILDTQLHDSSDAASNNEQKRPSAS